MKTKSLSLLRTTLIVTLLAAFVLTGCNSSSDTSNGMVVGTGNVINDTREVTGFTAVEFSSAGYLTISQGDAESLTIQAEDNIAPLITSDVVDGVLVIGIKDNQPVQTNSLIQVTLVVKDLAAIKNLSSGYVSINGLSTADFAYKSSGSGNMKLVGLEAETVDINLTGSGTAEVRGTADTLVVNQSASGAFDGSQLAVLSADVVNSGSANTTVNATEKLNADLSGSGSVIYLGTPEVTQTATGSGTVSAQE